MFKTILATASAALLAVSFGASAHASWSNGVNLNGLSVNGSINGLSVNGLSVNGSINGLSSNGLSVNGSINGLSSNGLSVNGSINGLSANGTINGLSANGVFEAGYVPQRAPSFVIDGIELPIQAR